MPPRNEAWDVWYNDLGLMLGRAQRQIKCKYCPLVMSYRADRMLAHLGYKAPQAGVRDVSICPLVPPAVRRMFQSCGGQVPTMADANMVVLNNTPMIEDEENSLEPLLSQTGNIADHTINNETIQLSQCTGRSNSNTGGAPPTERRQLSLQEGFNASAKDILDKAWAAAFYEANIPFNVVRHPAFIHAIQETARQRMPAYRPPSYNALRTSLLTSKKADVERKLGQKLGNSIEKYGVTLCSDGWDNVQNRPLLNIIQCGTNGDLFLGTIDTTGSHKDHTYVANQIRPFVEKVGPSHVVQVCTDNAPVMGSACRDLVESHPHLYVQGCAAHCLDLLLEDWGKEQWVKRLVKKGRNICTFINHHHASLAIFRRLSPDLGLSMPNETRFATNFIMLERLLQVRNALERTVIDDEWTPFLASLRRRSGEAHSKCLDVRSIIRSDRFWTSCENFLYMVNPVVKALRVFDGKAPAMGIAWKVMYDLKNHIEGFSSAPFNLDTNIAERALQSFQDRWTLMLTDLHWAGGLLNPTLRAWAPLHEHEQSRMILNRVFRKLTLDNDTYVKVLNQYQDFLENRGPFSEAIDPNLHGAPIHEWWDAMGSEAKALQTIARRLLAQVCSASSCERNWSMYSYVHNKSRNRLLHSRAEDLVYIYTNSRLLRHRRVAKPVQWYGLHQTHSDDESSGDDRNVHNGEGVTPENNFTNDNVEYDSGDAMDDLGSDNPISNGSNFEADNDRMNENNFGGLRVFEFENDNDIHEHDSQEQHDIHVERSSTLDKNCGGKTSCLEPVDAINPPNQENQPSTWECNPMPSIAALEVPEAGMIVPTFIQEQSCMHAEVETNEVNNTFIHESQLPLPPALQNSNRPLTRSLASGRGVGATLVALRTIDYTSVIRSSCDTNHQKTTLQGIGNRGRAYARHASIRAQSMDPARVSRTNKHSSTAHASMFEVGEGSTLPSTQHTTNLNLGVNSRSEGRRTTRGLKRQRRSQSRALPFAGDDYDVTDGRPHMDEHGILDTDNPHRTKKIVIRGNSVRLRSISPTCTDDDISTDDSCEDSRCNSANDPTVRVR
jgi:hypothetical protein